jgi:hypothetical protein
MDGRHVIVVYAFSSPAGETAVAGRDLFVCQVDIGCRDALAVNDLERKAQGERRIAVYVGASVDTEYVHRFSLDGA